jgi:Rps23 Pro-64 3,4-dihydroxylase Tpa1-like proline 4-hydroxylase
MFFYDIFSEQELAYISNDIESQLALDGWSNRAHAHEMHQQIVKSANFPYTQGDIYNKTITGYIKDLIRFKLGKIDPTIRNYHFDASYQIYNIGSCVFLHNDSMDLFNATFYFNKEWDVNSGGLYLYEDGTEYKVFVPKYNSCAFINQNTLVRHLVTPITIKAPDRRITIHCKGMPIFKLKQ